MSHRAASWVARILLVVLSSCGGVAIVEMAWRWRRSETLASVQPEARRYMLFGTAAGSAFQNVERFFLYRPDSVIRSATYFDTGGRVVKEYEYQFRANNLGLIQASDVEPGTPSVLVLGDSFTEGQGAEPWFEQLVPFFLAHQYQPVNGGILGTGFEQWILLHEHLRGRGIVIKKLVVVLISDDYEREVWNFPANVLNCLTSYLNCVGDEEFYGMPPDSQRGAFLERLSHYEPEPAKRPLPLRKRLPATEAAYRQSKYLVTQTWGWLSERFRGAAQIAGDTPYAKRVRFFSDLYGKDVIFVHLPTRDELRHGLDQPGVTVRKVIGESGSKFVDGFTSCGLTGADFQVHDAHPNAAGYSKIANCVRDAARQIMPVR